MTVTDERDRPGPERSAVHEARLALCKYQKERVHYACEVLVAEGGLGSGAVLDFLEIYGYLPRRSQQTANVRTLVSAWRRGQGLADTGGPIPAMTPEMLEILDARAVASETADANPRPRPLKVVREPAPAPAPAPAAASGQDQPFKAPKGALGFYVVAVMAIGVSVDTSFRFFGEKLGIHGVAQYALFTVMEAALIACGWAMAQNVRANRGPGPYRVTAWALCGFAAYAAVDLSGPIEGPARAVLGPALGLVMLHHALGIDKRAARGDGVVGTWGRVVWEYRERFLSLLGLGNDSRTALQRTRERSARRAARLVLAPKWTPFRKARLDRAIRQSGMDADAGMKDRMLSALAHRKHRDALETLELPSPWMTD